jgi:hypothetical protein
MPKKLSFTLLHEYGLDSYGLTQINFKSEGFFYYYRCKFGQCSLEKFATETDSQTLANGLGRVELDPELVNSQGFLDVYPQAHYIVIGKLLAELDK